jgi:hypothetical protein
MDQLQAIAEGFAGPIADSALATVTLAQLLATHRGIDARRLSSQLRRAAKRAQGKRRATLALVLGAMAKQVARKARG